jgi:hypothetical protein
LAGAALPASFSAFAQDGKAMSVNAFYDSTSVVELFNTVPVGFTFVSADGSAASTRGFLHGRIPWTRLHISSPQGVLRNGQLTFDRQKVWKNSHSVTFYIKIKGNDTLTCHLVLPYVEHIRFNLYTDSLKRDNPFYLNVEGTFSSGRVYPLDTVMLAFSKSGGGTLQGNVLTVKKGDTAVHRVHVEAWLKYDPDMRIEVSVPVKITADPTTLPTEQQVLKDWKKSRREGKR